MRRTITHMFSSFGSTSLLALLKSLKYKYIFLHIDTILLAARAQTQPWQSERDLKPTFVTRLAQLKNRHFDLCTWNTFLHWEEFPEKVNSKMSFGGASNNSQIDRKLQEELIAEDQKQRFQSQIHAFTDMCWEKCVDKPGSKLDGKTETCLVNCVERFLDTNIFIAKRFAEKFKGWASRIFKCSSIVTRSAKSRTI